MERRVGAASQGRENHARLVFLATYILCSLSCFYEIIEYMEKFGFIVS